MLLVACVALAGWLAVRARLAAAGIDQLSVSGVELGWNRLAFDSVSLTWSGDGRSVSMKTSHPRLTLDWLDWQLDRLVTGPTRIWQTGSLQAPSSPSTGSGHALELTLPDSLPFWLPRHLEIESLQATFPCQGTECRFRGKLRFDREAEHVTALVDATLSRDTRTLAIRGDVRLGAGADSQSVTTGELQVSGLRPWLPQALAEDIRALIPTTARLQFSPGGEPAPGTWPLTIDLTTQGGARPAFRGQVVLHTGEPWRLEITRGRLSAALEQWQRSGWLLDGLRAELPLSGAVTADQARLTLAPGAALSVSHMDAMDTPQLIWLDDVTLSPGGATVLFRDGRFRVNGPFAGSVAEVRYPGLVTQSWQADADVRWQQALELDGNLTNAAGSNLPFRIDYRPSGALEAALSMQLTADNDANHLAATITDWPESLVLNSGKVDASANVALAPERAPEVSGEVVFEKASGVYQAMAWQTLSGDVQGHWRNGELVIRTDALELARLNPGIPLGPILTVASYRAATERPARGTLTVTEASTGFAGGTVMVADDISLDLDNGPWQIPVQVHDVELSALMNLYPTEGLAGEGTLEGTLPVTIGPSGIRIDKGHISALPPGGHLQLPADKLGAMAQGNPAMALVTRAMQNFHYRLLESGINYAEDGTLVLDLRLRGSSPEVDSDRPVVLNINLQEDIPALLTSLQLSGRVNEAVTERVRERLMQEGVDTN